MANVAIFAELANMIRVGVILETDSEDNTATVSVTEFGASSYTSQMGDSVVTLSQKQVNRKVRVLTRGSKNVKDYFNYTAGEKVICVFPVKIGGGSFLTDTGYIAGSFYDDNRQPPAFFDQIRMIDFGVGNITVNLEDKSLEINFDGDISINGKNIYLNG